MDFLYSRLTGFLMLGWLSLSALLANGQVQTAKFITINSNTNGYYEYLPEGYDATGDQVYPLLIFLHGQGDLGNGRSDLPSLLQNGPPRYINEGKFPNTFVVNGKEFRFIVISPQFGREPVPSDVNAVVDFAQENYRVDPRRIYITGTSMGGGATWEYAATASPLYIRKLAAITPVCGKSSPDRARANRIADNDLPVWAFHNSGDNVVPTTYTVSYITYIRERTSANNPIIRMTIFNAEGHDAWTRAYDPAYKENNMSMYEWLLQYTRDGIAEGPLPVALSNYQVIRNNAGRALVSWTTSAEQNNAYFTIERSPDGIVFQELARMQSTNSPSGSAYTYTDEAPLPTVAYYRLSQTDLDGKTTLFEALRLSGGNSTAGDVSVYPNPAADFLTIRLDNPVTGRLSLSVFDQNGRKVKTSRLIKQEALWTQQIEVTGLRPGFYMVEIREANGVRFTRTFIKK